MNFTLSKKLCRDCSRKYDGYGCTSEHTEQYYTQLVCEECGGGAWFLMQFHIPEKDIRFVNGGRYTVFTWWEVKVDGRILLTPDKTPLKLEYTETFPPFSENHTHHWNAKNEKEYHDKFEVNNETVHFEYSDQLVPDDVFEALKIYLNKNDIRRVTWKSEGDLGTDTWHAWPEYY